MNGLATIAHIAQIARAKDFFSRNNLPEAV